LQLLGGTDENAAGFSSSEETEKQSCQEALMPPWPVKLMWVL